MNGDGFVSALGILFCPSFFSFNGYLEVYLLMEELIFPLAVLGTGDLPLLAAWKVESILSSVSCLKKWK